MAHTSIYDHITPSLPIVLGSTFQGHSLPSLRSDGSVSQSFHLLMALPGVVASEAILAPIMCEFNPHTPIVDVKVICFLSFKLYINLSE